MKSLKHSFYSKKLCLLLFSICFFQFYSTGQTHKPETFTANAVKLSDYQIDENQTTEIIDFLNRHQDIFQSFENERMTLMPFTDNSKSLNDDLNKRIDEYSIKNNYPYNSISSSQVYREFSNDYINHIRIKEEREFKLKKEKARIIEESNNN